MNLGKWLQVAEQFAPLVLVNIPGIPAVVIPLVVHALKTAEQKPGATGADKKAFVMSELADGLAIATVKNPTLNAAAITSAVSSGLDTTITVVNAVHQAAPSA